MKAILQDLSNLRILFLAGTLGQGGAERQLYYTIKALVAQGATVQVAALSGSEYWGAHIRALGVPLIELMPPRPRWFRLVKLLRLLRSFRPHIIQSQHFYANAYVALGGRLTGVPEIGAIRGSGYGDIESMGAFGAQLNLKSPRLLAANSKMAIRYLVSQGVDETRLFFLPNVVDTEHFRPAPARQGGSDVFKILTVGRLIALKQFDKLLFAVAELLKQVEQPIEFRIVGAGPEHAKLEQLSHELGLDEVVEFCGTTPNVLPHYQWADLFVLASSSEGTPNVILEAMACGLPVVATRVGGIPDLVVDGQHGFLIDNSAEDETSLDLVNKMRLLIEQADLRNQLGACAYTHVVNEYSFESMPHNLLTLYQQTLQNVGCTSF